MELQRTEQRSETRGLGLHRPHHRLQCRHGQRLELGVPSEARLGDEQLRRRSSGCRHRGVESVFWAHDEVFSIRGGAVKTAIDLITEVFHDGVPQLEGEQQPVSVESGPVERQ